MQTTPTITALRLVVFMPNWLGDGVMATPLLRALREVYPRARITAVHRPLLSSVLAGLPWLDESWEFPQKLKRTDWPAVLQRLRDDRHDLAILLPNSFRSALLARRAGIPRRLGYAREGRALLLTDRLSAPRKTAEQKCADRMKIFSQSLIADSESIHSGEPDEILDVTRDTHRLGFYHWTARDRRSGHITQRQRLKIFNLASLGRVRGYQPTPTIDYYLALARYLGYAGSNQRMELRVTPAEITEAHPVLAAIPAGTPLVVLVPGANFGAAKCWPAERYAQVADQLIDPAGPYRAIVLIASAPAERPIVEAIMENATHASSGRLLPLIEANNGQGLSLGALKEIVRRSQLMICNDTGPRHFAAAFNIPVVTLFGPTDPLWAETYHPRERIVRVAVPCGPCQLKVCPTDHRCMTRLTADLVMNAVREIWPKSGEAAA